MAKPRPKLTNGPEKVYSHLNGEGKVPDLCNERLYRPTRGVLYRGIKKKRATQSIRRSARLRDIRKGSRESYPLSSPASYGRSGKVAEHLAAASQVSTRKRKRQQEPEDELQSSLVGKRPRADLTAPEEKIFSVEAASGISESKITSIGHWRKEGHWPKQYFERDSSMDPLLARKKSSSSLRRKQSDAGSVAPSSMTPSDQKPREEKSAPYRDARYAIVLETKGIFMKGDKEGPKKDSKDLCRYLLEEDQDTPEISRFSNNVFELTCQRIQNRNEAKVIQDIARLIVPSAEELADFGAEQLECLVESVNEGWNNSIPVTGTRPQPDYSVGFDRTAFTKDQFDKLRPFIGDFLGGDLSFFMGTFYMYFPFLTCEVKCGAQALDIADRQNAHSMTLAVRAVVEIFRRVKREKEVDREILAFSVCHDYCSVRIYGYYPVIEERETKYYRYTIHMFNFTALEGKEKWTAYKFVKNLYDTWMPDHFKRLCSVIDELQSEPDFGVPPLSEGTGLSQVFESHHLSRSNTNLGSLSGQDDSQASRCGPQDITPNTSFSQLGSFKKPRKRRLEES